MQQGGGGDQQNAEQKSEVSKAVNTSKISRCHAPRQKVDIGKQASRVDLPSIREFGENRMSQLTQKSLPPLGICLNAHYGVGSSCAEWRSISDEPIGEPYASGAGGLRGGRTAVATPRRFSGLQLLEAIGQ